MDQMTSCGLSPYHRSSNRYNISRCFLRFYYLIVKGELNLYNKWQSDDLFHIVINENHPRGNRF